MLKARLGCQLFSVFTTVKVLAGASTATPVDSCTRISVSAISMTISHLRQLLEAARKAVRQAVLMTATAALLNSRYDLSAHGRARAAAQLSRVFAAGQANRLVRVLLRVTLCFMVRLSCLVAVMALRG